MQDTNSKLTRERIEKCIWETDIFGKANKTTLKIDSEVATDNDKGEFIELLRTGIVKINSKSQYVRNYQFFHKKIDNFLQEFAGYFPYFPARLLNNCILLPIEAESQDTALRIFSTLNDRGLPLSDADIFKAQFYKYYGDLNQKEKFIDDWRKLEELTKSIFQSISGTPMDEIFSRYMYFLRAKEINKSTTTEALRKFYERNEYQYLTRPETIDDLKTLAEFWKSVSIQDKDRFSEDIRKTLFVLNFAPNGMWQNITSVYFLQNKNDEGLLDNDKFINFLRKITAFIFAYAISNPGVNALRTPVYDEMVNIVNGSDISFFKNKFNEMQTRTLFENYSFTNLRAITRSIITWYAFTFENQQVLDIKENYELEHIYPRKRQEMEGGLQNEGALESLGNKILLEESINIRASDYHFEDKKKIYTGQQRRGKNKEASKIAELHEIVAYSEFNENEIVQRNKQIINKFFEFLRSENLFS